MRKCLVFLCLEDFCSKQVIFFFCFRNLNFVEHLINSQIIKTLVIQSCICEVQVYNTVTWMLSILFAIQIFFIKDILCHHREVNKMLSNSFRNSKGVYNFNLFLFVWSQKWNTKKCILQAAWRRSTGHRNKLVTFRKCAFAVSDYFKNHTVHWNILIWSVHLLWD